MKRRFWSKDFSEIIHDTEIQYTQVNKQLQHSHSNTTSRLNYKDIVGEYGLIQANGFSIDYASLSQNVVIEVQVEQAGPHLELHFELEGEKMFTSHTGKELVIPTGTHSLLFIPELKGELTFIPKQNHRREVGIEFSIDYFMQLFDHDLSVLGNFGKKLLAGELAVLTERAPTTPTMRQLIDDILLCPFTGVVKKLYVEAKVHELIALVVQQTQLSTSSRGTDIKRNDIEKLFYAKEIIVQRIHEPCSLMQLSRLTGLNDFKLKKGFRDLFGTTVFGYLLEERMRLAKRFLVEERLTIAEIATEVGYKNPTHFTAAFKRHFGYLPSEFRNNL